MSEPTPETPQPTTPAPEAPPSPTPNPAPEQDINSLPEWARESLSKANREAAGYRTQVRELEPLAAKAKELEQAQMTEQQKLSEQLAAERETAAKATAEAIRYRVAATHHIGQEDFDLLGTGTEEEITARAVRIAARNAEIAALQAAPRPPSSERPIEQLRPGATPGEPQSEDDVLYAQLFPPQPQR
jgi:hypothetical protein